MPEIRSSRQRKTAEQSRLDLIEAGFQCLAEGGLAGFTIDKVTRRAKISRGLINFHFNTKNDFLMAIYEHYTSHQIVEPAEATPLQQIAGYIERSFHPDNLNKLNVEAWLALWSAMSYLPELKSLHTKRYHIYIRRHAVALQKIALSQTLDTASIARQLSALIDGFWLEYFIHSDGFSISEAKMDCYRLLESELHIKDLFGK